MYFSSLLELSFSLQTQASSTYTCIHASKSFIFQKISTAYSMHVSSASPEAAQVRSEKVFSCFFALVSFSTTIEESHKRN